MTEIVPEYVLHLRTLQDADKESDIRGFVQAFRMYCQSVDKDSPPKSLPFVLVLKLTLLQKLDSLVTFDRTETNTNTNTGEASVGYAKAHPMFVDEIQKILQFFMASAKKSHRTLDGALLSDVSIDAKGELGEKLSVGLVTLLAKKNVSEKQLAELSTIWRQFSDHFTKLSQGSSNKSSVD
ncbi:hypothetical protein V5T82_16295 [Magnetovibrio sp. PR-2]|uniref:hypothetical protein n=1 Tax=Magnetovibrio sp. PR-2 TaxID=3120356 RepID=UPI002FCE1E1B